MRFIQTIEFQTSDLSAFHAALDDWLRATEGTRGADRGTLTADRDRPGTYVQIVEFPSYEAAMANSDDVHTHEFAARLREHSDVGPTFRNLDVVRVDELS